MKSKDQAPIEFVEKIKAKMIAENLGVTQLARKVGVSHPTIVELVTHGNKPSFETCIALSEWLEQSPILTWREAGLLDAKFDAEVRLEDWKHLLARSLPEEEEETKQILTMKIDRRQKAQQSERAKNFKPKKAG